VKAPGFVQPISWSGKEIENQQTKMMRRETSKI
jgi:hypothetical protein